MNAFTFRTNRRSFTKQFCICGRTFAVSHFVKKNSPEMNAQISGTDTAKYRYFSLSMSYRVIADKQNILNHGCQERKHSHRQYYNCSTMGPMP
jgi:hypothetical protein